VAVRLVAQTGHLGAAGVDGEVLGRLHLDGDGALGAVAGDRELAARGRAAAGARDGLRRRGQLVDRRVGLGAVQAVGPCRGRGGRREGCARRAVARTLERVSVVPAPSLTLDARFADAVPELALPWQADEPPDPRLLVLDEALVAELGLDADWLRTPEGVRLLV